MNFLWPKYGQTVHYCTLCASIYPWISTRQDAGHGAADPLMLVEVITGGGKVDYKKADGLRSLSKVLKTVAWIVLILGLIGGIAAMVAGQQAGQEVAQRAPTAAEQIGDQRAERALEATGTGLTATGITGGILAIVMAVVWFLILYALGGICDATADIWDRSRATASESVSTRREVGPATSADYSTRPVPPPAGAPS